MYQKPKPRMSARMPVAIVVALRDGQPIDDAEDDLAKNDDGEQPEPLDQRIGRRHPRAEAHGRTTGEDDPDDPGADETVRTTSRASLGRNALATIATDDEASHARGYTHYSTRFVKLIQTAAEATAG
jgi:hypothetical protein